MAGIKYSTGYYSLNGGHLTSAPSSSLPVARVMNGTRARQNPFDGRHHGGGVGGVGGGGIKTRSEFYDRRDLLSFGAMHKPIYFGIPPAVWLGSSQTNISSDKKREGDRGCRLSTVE